MPSVEQLESTKMSVPKETSIPASDAGPIAACIEASKENSPPAAVEQQQPSAHNINNDKDALSPVQQMCLIIEHKIRNLEKRKNKLDSYKLLEEEGKLLSNDQKMAILKYDECVTSLELAREFCKQFSAIATVATRDAKRQAKKNAYLKVQQENAKIRECLVVLDTVSRFTADEVREDFLNGTNGACQLAETDVELVMMVLEQTKPRRPMKSTDVPFSSSIRSAAEILSGIVDGRAKAFGSSNYAHVKSIMSRIENCGYFEKHVTLEETEFQSPKEDQTEKNEICLPVVGETPMSMNEQKCVQNQQHIFAEAPAATAVPTPSFPLQSNEHTNVCAPHPVVPAIQPQPSPVNTLVTTEESMQSAVVIPPPNINLPVVAPINPGLQLPPTPVAATTVQAVENAYFNQHYLQNHLRPLHEVLGNANFFFLQESEIDKPDILPMHSTYVSIDQTTPNIPLNAAGHEFQKFAGVQDPQLMMSAKPPMPNPPPPHSDLVPNVAISNGSNRPMTNHNELPNEAQIIHAQPLTTSTSNQSGLKDLQVLPGALQHVPNQQPVLMHMASVSYGQQHPHALISANDNEHERNHMPAFLSSNAIVSSTLPLTRVQEPNNLPGAAHASVQTHKPHGVPGNQVLAPENAPLQMMNNTAIAIDNNIVAHIQMPNMRADYGMKNNNPDSLNVSSKDHNQSSGKDGLLGVKSLKTNEKNTLDSNTSTGTFPMKCDAQTNRKKSSVAKGNLDERKGWVKVAGASENLDKNDQWPSPASSSAKAQLKTDDGSVGRNSFHRTRPSGNGHAARNESGAGMLPSEQNNSNGGAASAKLASGSAAAQNVGSNISHTSPHAGGYRSNRSSNTQYSQNGLNNGMYA
ncbi:caprin homolog [Anopheles ziemanni]|uniref:caprin homolog n=1 Tax=Anopheles ziemanni TaxID=345580 RepID=UPI00265FBC45|nr:caprin homolog [Anopheles ziemanni]